MPIATRPALLAPQADASLQPQDWANAEDLALCLATSGTTSNLHFSMTF